MTRAAARTRIKKAEAKRARLHRHPKPRPVRRTSDRAIYIGLVLIGGFFLVLAYLFTDGLYWRHAAVGYAALVAIFINHASVQVYLGKHIAHWRQSLAKIPLRAVGYGTRDGKPLEAAHGHVPVRKAVVACVVISLVLLAGLWLALFPQVVFG